MSVTLLICVAIINLSTALSDSDDVYRSKNSDDYVPCENGWYYFRDKCYRASGRNINERFTWSRALDLCRRYGADLVSIQSQEEQDFINGYLTLDIASFSWTGLNDRDTEGDYRWSDGSVFNYSNWDINQPSTLGSRTGYDEEDCVQIVFDPARDAIGKWNDRSCEATEYAICEMKANPRKRSPNLMYCSREEGGGWKHGSSCYHIVTELKSWGNAERHCKTYFNGHLLTIRDMTEDLFVEDALPHIEEDIWIGIRIEEQLQQKWTSGWYVSYDRFNKDERYEEGNCVARKNRKEWITMPCSSSLPFICEISKDTPPVLVPPPAGSRCPKQLDDWRDFGGDYCYYIKIGKNVNYYEASFDCQRRGGDLVSFHSKEELEILKPFVIYKGERYFIGLIRLHENNEETFGWTDGSVLNYQNFAHNEPNRLEEKCAVFYTHDMKWHDHQCDVTSAGYICSVKKIISSSNLEEADNCESFCIAPNTYLYGIISQNLNEAKRMSCKK